MRKIDLPRLLPTTIATLAALLSLKCGILLQGVVRMRAGRTAP
jgi:hypothetical protein